MGDLTQPAPPGRQLPFREDCWTEEATWTLVEAWGRRFVELNRGNLRQKDWQEVADAVNARHGHTKKTRRTDVQCKNRIDTLKKKYKIEKTRIAESGGSLKSPWPFYPRLEYLIGSNISKHQNTKHPPSATSFEPSDQLLTMPSPPMALPLPYRQSPSSAIVTPVILPQKRPVPSPPLDDSYFRRNDSALAASAAAATANEEDAESEGGEAEGSEERVAADMEEEEVEGGSMGRLAKAIERFGEIYEKVEGMKQREMVELEKQRMQFAKDLEVQRMQLFMDTQVQFEKIKRARRSRSSNEV